MSKSKKIVVFGGSGFLGSHVADALTEAGHDVAIFDLRPSKFLQKNQKMIVGDILNAQKVVDAVQGCEIIYNFAGFSDLDYASIKPIDTIQLNILGNTVVMNAALKAKVERFIYASTIYVYSEKGGFYRCSKQSSELYIEEYHRAYRLDYTILRFSTLYGPRADERNSIYRYLKQALTAGRIDYNGTGEEVRDYIHVKDAASLSVKILDEQFKNMPITISGHHPVKFKEMVETVREIIGKDIKINYKDRSNSTAHYMYTPYSFTPRVGHKLTDTMYTDMGQGLLECLHGINGDLDDPNDKNSPDEVREMNLNPTK